MSKTPWTVAHQAPLSMGYPMQEYWSGLPFPPPGDLPDPGIKLTSPVSPALAVGFFATVPPRKTLRVEPSWRELVALGKRPQETPFCLAHCEDTARRVPWVRKWVLSKHRLCQHHDPGLATLQNCEKWVSAVCKPLVYSILLKQPGWTKTIPFSVTVVSAQPVWTARGTRKPTEARNGRRKCQIWVTLNDPMTFPLRHSSMWKSTQFPRLPSPDLPSDALNIPSCIHGAWTSAFLLLCSK